MSQGRWPDSYQCAISITMDNMGEAAELYRGTWPEDRTIGLHRAVTDYLPNMMQILDENAISATYFIEGWNTAHYPGAIGSLRRAGHEVAFHGWQHEPWSHLSPDDERELFDRSLNGFAKLGLTIRGFRPPGGVLTERSPQLLSEHELTYCSPAAAEAAIRDGIVYLPFSWTGIDAYYYSDAFAGLRSVKGDSEAPIAPAVFQERLDSLIDQRLSSGGYTAFLFHPFLTSTEDRLDVMRHIVGRLSSDSRIWCAPCRQIAQWVLDHPAEFPSDPERDTTSWSR